MFSLELLQFSYKWALHNSKILNKDRLYINIIKINNRYTYRQNFPRSLILMSSSITLQLSHFWHARVYLIDLNISIAQVHWQITVVRPSNLFTLESGIDYEEYMFICWYSFSESCRSHKYRALFSNLKIYVLAPHIILLHVFYSCPHRSFKYFPILIFILISILNYFNCK